MAKTICKYEVKNINQTQWEGLLKTHPEANFLQSWFWGEFYQNLGKKIHRDGFFINNNLAGVMLSIVETAKRGKYLTVPGGPIISWQDQALVKLAFARIKKVALENDCVFARVRPQLEDNEFSRALFKAHGFTPSPMHLHAETTSQLDITLPEKNLLANMRKTTRYEIKKALSENIKIQTTDNPEAIGPFYQLQLQTAQRQGFVPFSFEYLYQQFKVFASNKKALLFSAYSYAASGAASYAASGADSGRKLLAQAFIIFYNQEAVYHYGASTDQGRKYPGAYAIQWEAILEAKKRGIKRYNFWGVSKENDTTHRFHGVSVFKRGFAGKDINYLHAQDLIISRPRYLINFIVETLRKKIRRV